MHVNLKLNNLIIPTHALVSEHVSEPLIGFDWLSNNKVYWGFGDGEIVIGGITFSLADRDISELNCCRIVVQDNVTVPRTSETILPAKIIFDSAELTRIANRSSEYMIEGNTLKEGLYVARVVIPHQCKNIPVRILNPLNHDVALIKDKILGEIQSVKTTSVCNLITTETTDVDWREKLIADADSELTDNDREQLRDLLTTYEDCFSRSEYDLGRTNFVQHQIDTGTNQPIKQPLRRQPISYLPEIDRQVGEMLDQDIIRPCVSPWASNVVIVTKKDGSKRFCIDYRKLNDITKKDSYPLPRISDCLDALGGSKYFSAFDLRSGYHQVAMSEADMEKTSFITRNGTYCFTAMPFGLCNAPATFQRVMDFVMSGLNYQICLVYLDDVIVFSSNLADHFDRLKLLFDRLRKANLKLKPSKCHLFRKTVNFLGHVVSENGISTDPEKISCVVDWPIPTSVTEVRSFLGLCSYYRRFVQGFSEIAAPLHALTMKHAIFSWIVSCQKAFDDLKGKLVSAPILAMPQDDGQYYLDTDASGKGIGAVLSQV